VVITRHGKPAGLRIGFASLRESLPRFHEAAERPGRSRPSDRSDGSHPSDRAAARSQCPIGRAARTPPTCTTTMAPKKGRSEFHTFFAPRRRPL